MDFPNGFLGHVGNCIKKIYDSSSIPKLAVKSRLENHVSFHIGKP